MSRRSKDVLRLVRNILFVLALMTTLYFGLVTQVSIPSSVRIIPRPDLALHAAAFAVCALLAPRVGRWGLPTAAALGSTAAAIEMVQYFQPDRTASLVDIAAGFAGIAAGLIAASTLGMAAARFLR